MTKSSPIKSPEQSCVTPSRARGLLFVPGQHSRFLAPLGMTVFFVTAILLVGTLLTSTVRAQIIGPGPKQGKVQVGGWFAAVEHDIRSKSSSSSGEWDIREDVDYERAALMVRYGITNAAYALVNFGHYTRFEEHGDEASGVLGIGGNVRIYQRLAFNLRIGGQYNKVVRYLGPSVADDVRVALTIDRAIRGKSSQLTFAAGLMYFRATVDRNGSYDYFQRENVHSLAPVVSAVQVVADRVGLGLELTFGAITDFRWRTEIQF